jgi:hypothetical protein
MIHVVPVFKNFDLNARGPLPAACFDRLFAGLVREVGHRRAHFFCRPPEMFVGRLSSGARENGLALESISGRSIREGGEARAAMDVYAESLRRPFIHNYSNRAESMSTNLGPIQAVRRLWKSDGNPYFY